jgi:hypothetical protein
MSVITDTKQQELENGSKAVRRPVATASRKSDRKVAGTRVGTVEDWRGGDTKATRETSPRGKTLRDGR